MPDLTIYYIVEEAGCEVYDAICALEDDEAVVTYQGSLYEKIKRHSMGYYFDTHYYAIGLIDWNNED